MDYETLLASFILIILFFGLLPLLQQRPTQIYVHTCNGYSGAPQPQASDSESEDENNEAGTCIVTHVVVSSDSDSEEETDTSDKKEDKETNSTSAEKLAAVEE